MKKIRVKQIFTIYFIAQFLLFFLNVFNVFNYYLFYVVISAFFFIALMIFIFCCSNKLKFNKYEGK